VLGYVATFLIVLAIGIFAPKTIGQVKGAMGQANIFRGIFFVMTFFSIGVVSNFRKLWEEGIGRLAAVYVLCLFGLHHLDRAGYLVAILPRHATAAPEG